MSFKPQTPKHQRIISKYLVRYDHKHGKLVITVTDDNVRLQYKTDQAQDVKRLEKLLAAQMRETLGVVKDEN